MYTITTYSTRPCEQQALRKRSTRISAGIRRYPELSRRYSRDGESAPVAHEVAAACAISIMAGEVPDNV